MRVVCPRLLDRDGMAEAISVSTDTLDGLRKRGCPEVPVVGTSKVLFDPEEVVRWIKEQAAPLETRTEIEAKDALDDLLQN